MSTIFLYCASIGGALLVLQFLLLLIGVGGDGDLGDGHAGAVHAVDGSIDGHAVGHDQGSFLRMLSLQTLATFATFFGLVGLSTEQLGWSRPSVLSAAVLAGAGALALVARAMRFLMRAQSSGSLELANAIGREGRVYLRVPAAGHGHGRVLVPVQGRTVECRAISRGLELPTGAPIRVVALDDDGALVVDAAQ